MNNNRSRVLSEVVSLDAWHGPIESNSTSSSVSVEINFKEGRIGGGDEDFPFTFKLSLKRALLKLRLESPLKIDRTSIARNIPDAQVKHTELITARNQATAEVKAGGKINPALFTAALSGQVETSTEVSKQEEMSVVRTVPPILVSSEPRNQNEYCWTLEPTYLPYLMGQPWDPVNDPRLLAKYDYNKIGKIDPVIEATLTCAFEDIEIDDILPKDETLQKRVSNFWKGDTRMSAAKQHLKTVLQNYDLEPGSMDNRFASLLVASVIATTE